MITWGRTPEGQLRPSHAEKRSIKPLACVEFIRLFQTVGSQLHPTQLANLPVNVLDREPLGVQLVSLIVLILLVFCFAADRADQLQRSANRGSADVGRDTIGGHKQLQRAFSF